MRHHIFGILVLLCLGTNGQAQEIYCDSIIGTTRLLRVEPGELKTSFSFNNIASNADAVSKTRYVYQWVTIENNPVIASIAATSTSGLPTYIYSNQTFEYDITYKSNSDTGTIIGFHHIYIGGFPADTCHIPFKIIVDQPTGFSFLEQENSNLYPNPARTEVSVSLPENASANIYALGGQLVEAPINGSTINVSHLPKGVYIVEFRTLAGVSLGFERLVIL